MEVLHAARSKAGGDSQKRLRQHLRQLHLTMASKADALVTRGCQIGTSSPFGLLARSEP